MRGGARRGAAHRPAHAAREHARGAGLRSAAPCRPVLHGVLFHAVVVRRGGAHLLHDEERPRRTGGARRASPSSAADKSSVPDEKAPKAPSRVSWARVAVVLAGFVVTLALALLYAWLERGHDWLSATWQRPWAWAGLVFVPWVLWRATWGVDRRSAHVRLGTVAPFAGGPVGWRARCRDLPGTLRAAGLVLCLAALARPVSSIRPAIAEEEGIALVGALDLPGSMEAVMDNLPAELEKYLGERP